MLLASPVILGLQCLSAALIVLASRAPALGGLAFVALVPSLLTLPPGAPARRWWHCGSVLFLVLCGLANSWIYEVTHDFGSLSEQISTAAVVAFALISFWPGAVGYGLYGALQPAIARLGARLRLTPAAAIAWHTMHGLAFAALLTASWHLVPAIFFWDWSLLLRYQPWLIHNLPLLGAPGLDACILFVNYMVAAACLHRAWQLLLISALVIIALLVNGYAQYARTAAWVARAGTARIALVQPNIDSGAKADRRNIQRSLHTLMSLSEQAVAQDAPHLVIWPESVFPLDLQESPALLSELSTATTTWDASLLLGSTHIATERSGFERYYNTAVLLQADTAQNSAQIQTYRKHVLLAFGEYIPLETEFPQIRNWLPARIGEFGRGPGPTVFHTDAPDLTFAPVICYESIDRQYMQRVAAQPIQFVTELTNDGWYGTTAAVTYHKDLTALRAIEFGLSIVRTTNTGITTVIDPLGRELGTLPQQIADVTVVDVPLRNVER